MTILNRAEQACREYPDERAEICFARVDLVHQGQHWVPKRVDEGWIFPKDVEEEQANAEKKEATQKTQAALKLMEMAQQHKKKMKLTND